jgi:hypothetical protein
VSRGLHGQVAAEYTEHTEYRKATDYTDSTEYRKATEQLSREFRTVRVFRVFRGSRVFRVVRGFAVFRGLRWSVAPIASDLLPELGGARLHHRGERAEARGVGSGGRGCILFELSRDGVHLVERGA